MEDSIPENAGERAVFGQFSYELSYWGENKILIQLFGILNKEVFEMLRPLIARLETQPGRQWYVIVQEDHFQGINLEVRPDSLQLLAALFKNGVIRHMAFTGLHPVAQTIARYMQLVYANVSFSFHTELQEAFQCIKDLESGNKVHQPLLEQHELSGDGRDAKSAPQLLMGHELDDYLAYQFALLESGELSVWVVNQELQLIYFNPIHAANMLRLNGQVLQLGRSILEYKLAGHSDEEVTERYARALRGETFHLQYQLTDLEGKSYWIRIDYRPLFRKGEIMGVMVLARDISEAKFKEQQVTDYREMIRSLSENVQEGLYRSSMSGGILYVNQHFCELFGYQRPEELMGMDFSVLYADPERRRELSELIVDQGAFRNQEVLFRRKDGSFFWGLISSTHSAHALDGDVFDGAIRDITLIKQTQLELQLAKEEAEKATRSKSLFLSQMSHEIRTPLNAILGNAFILLEEIPDQHYRNQLENMVRSGQHLLQVINDILDFSRIEAGHVTLHDQVFNLPQLLQELRDQLRFQAIGKNITLQLELDADLPERVIADKVKLSQVLLNLGGNAVKFTQDGNVLLRATVRERLPDKIQLEFQVRDTGIGIKHDKLDRIFESFSQADGDINRRFGGTGLGLAIAKGILDAMKGNIKVESEPGEGTVFTVSVAVAVAPGSERDQVKPAMKDKPDLQQLKVLVVEDNQLNNALLERLLQMWNAKVTCVEHGQGALEYLQDNRPDVVLLDLHMPDMDGFQLYEQIRHLDIPVVALTADVFEETRQRVLAAGMRAFMPKPFDPAALLSVLSSLKAGV